MAINLDKVKEYDFAVVLDASGSTAENDVKAGFFKRITRWEAIQNSASTFIKDLSNITGGNGTMHLVVMGGNVKAYPSVGVADVAEALSINRPGGGTPLALALTSALNMLSGSTKKKFIMVFTDGVPDSKQAAKQVIINQANSQKEDDECTILFVQVGEDSSATAYLATLDDDLKEAKFDIVDAKTAKEAAAFESTMALILHAIED